MELLNVCIDVEKVKIELLLVNEGSEELIDRFVGIFDVCGIM